MLLFYRKCLPHLPWQSITIDDLEKAIAKLNDRQQGTEKKLEELASKISGKAKVIQIRHP